MLTRWFESPSWPALGFGFDFPVLRSVFDDPSWFNGFDAARRQLQGGEAEFEVQDDPTHVVLRAPLPGVSEKDLKIVVQGTTLTIRGEGRSQAPDGYNLLLRERSNRRFAHSFTLSHDLDGHKADARLEDGVLTLRIPKKVEAQPREIQVRVS